MGFIEAVKTCLSKYATFEGVASRSEYWWFVLFMAIGAAVAASISMGLYAIWLLGMLLPGLAVGVRRLHDIDLSGWWLLLSAVPLVGLIVLVWSVSPSKPSSRWAPVVPASEPTPPTF